MATAEENVRQLVRESITRALVGDKTGDQVSVTNLLGSVELADRLTDAIVDNPDIAVITAPEYQPRYYLCGSGFASPKPILPSTLENALAAYRKYSWQPDVWLGWRWERDSLLRIDADRLIARQEGGSR